MSFLYKDSAYSPTSRLPQKFDFRSCRHVEVSYRLVQAKDRRKSGFLSQSGLKQLVRDAPLSDRVYYPNDKYRFCLRFKIRKPNGGLVLATAHVHYKGHGNCVVFKLHTPRL